MSDAVLIASSTKRAELRTAVRETYADTFHPVELICLETIARGALDEPQIAAVLTTEEINYLPNKAQADAVLVAGYQALSSYRRAQAELDAILAELDAETITESQAISAIEAVVF